MFRISQWSAALALLSAGSFTADALVIDFESVAASQACTQHGTSVSTQGFTITQAQGTDRLFACDGTNPGVGSNGTHILLDDTSPGSDFSIAESSGAPFDFLSFDAGEAFASPSQQNQNAVGIGLAGFLVGGGIVQTQFLLDGVIDGPGGSADFETFTLPATWVNLTSVRMAWASLPNQNLISVFAIDNLNVHVVPEPATISLIGLAFLVITRRR